jgi:DNA-binding transcriptional ArsR family regulator
MGVSRRSVERRIEALEKKGFLKRLPTEYDGESQGPRYELSGLVKKLETAAATGLVWRAYERRRRSTALKSGDGPDD